MNTALLKHNCRRYGMKGVEGVNELKVDLSRPLDFFVLDMRFDDVLEERFVPYDTKDMCDDSTYGDNCSDSSLEGSNPAHVLLFGRTEEGYSITARVPFFPFIYAKVPQEWRAPEIGYFRDEIAKRLNLDVKDVRVNPEKRKQMYGWIPDRRNPTKTAELLVVKISVPNGQKLNHLKGLLKGRYGMNIPNVGAGVKITTWETRVDLVHKFCDTTKIVPSGWVRVSRYEAPDGFISHSQIEIKSLIANISPLEKADIPPLLIASVDGEMYSSNHQFPNPLNKNDFVITIGTTLWRFGTDQTDGKNFERFAFCLKETAPVKDCTVIWCNDEQELLKKWRDFIAVEADPDIVIGYNILGFDWKYFGFRAQEKWKEDGNCDEHECIEEEKEDNTEILGLGDDEEEGTDHVITPSFFSATRFFKLSRLWNESCPIRVHTFKSSAYGERDSYRFDMTGRITIDLLHYVRREFKLGSYKLDAIAFHFLKDRKIDLPAKTMFSHFEGTPETRALIAEYCAKDCDLPINLLTHKKINALPNLVEMSRVTFTSLPLILEKGQQIKVFNQLVWYGHEMGFVMNDKPWDKNQRGFVGATVVDPKKGWYDCPITTLDFASLYPSIIQNKNLCYSTYVIDDRYKNIPGVEYVQINVGPRKHTFVSKKHQRGILPILEQNLLSARRAVKKQMKNTDDPALYAMLNGKQLAIKISCNSVFGFTGASNGMYPNPAIAESITATGREMIEETKKIVTGLIKGTDVIYGDSVVGSTPLLLNHRGTLELKTIESLWSELSQEPESLDIHKKHYQNVQGYSTWTERGWTPILRIMRHRVNKPIINVETTEGLVQVTEDHSLLSADSTPISPAELDRHTHLLSNMPNIRGTYFFQKLHDEFNNNRSQVQYFENSLQAARFYWYFRALGYQVTIEYNNNTYKCQYRLEEAHEDYAQVLYTNQLTHQEPVYVYDLTTENHHFHAGVGSLIVHNTDSVMVKFPVSSDKEGIKESFRLGEIAAKKVTEVMGEAIELEMEKVYFPYLLFGKKRYAGLMFTNPEKPDYIDNKGIEVVRRDWSGVTREVMKDLLDLIFFERDVEGAKNYVRTTVKNMIDGKIPIEKFVISKSLKGKYANSDSQPHVQVVRKIAQRNPGSEPTVGDRVPYVIIRVNKKKPKLFEQTEDPDYVRDNPKKVQLDYIYYIDKQLKKPLEKLFLPFMDNPDNVNDAQDQFEDELFHEARTQIQNEYDGVGREGIMAYFDKKKRERVSSDEESEDDMMCAMLARNSQKNNSNASNSSKTKKRKVERGKTSHKAQSSLPKNPTSTKPAFLQETKSSPDTKPSVQENLFVKFASQDKSGDTDFMAEIEEIRSKSSPKMELESVTRYSKNGKPKTTKPPRPNPKSMLSKPKKHTNTPATSIFDFV